MAIDFPNASDFPKMLRVSGLSDVKKVMQNESDRSDKDRDPEAVLGGF
jgi:hypothetical protein